jgi:hypothetical protein
VKRIFAMLMLTLFIVAAMAVTASVAFADNPHAGNSGHFKGSAKPCDNQNNHPKCPGPH